MAWPSLAHSPKSISLQRSLQKGLNLLSGLQTTSFWQVGQLTLLGTAELQIMTVALI